MSHRYRTAMLRIALLNSTLLLGTLPACSDLVPPDIVLPSSSDVVFSVEPLVRDYTMAVGEEQQITLVVRNLVGEIMSIADSMTSFTLEVPADSAWVRVDSSGHILARSSKVGKIQIVATVRSGVPSMPVTTSTAVYVSITDTAAPVTAISIQPLPSDSARFGYGLTKRILGRAFTATGAEVVGVGMTIFTDRVQGVGSYISGFNNLLIQEIGPFWIRASALVYGTLLRDSLLFTGLERSTGTITMSRSGSTYLLSSIDWGKESTESGGLVLQPCGTVRFENKTTDTLRVTWSNPSNVLGCVPSDEYGDILELLPGGSAIRKIRAVGRYDWSMSRHDGAELTPVILPGGIPFANADGYVLIK